MNILTGLADSVPRVAAEALLNSVWQGAALAFCVWLSLRLFRRAGAGLKYGVWSAALLAVVCLPFLNAFNSWGTSAPKAAALRGVVRTEIPRLEIPEPSSVTDLSAPRPADASPNDAGRHASAPSDEGAGAFTVRADSSAPVGEGVEAATVQADSAGVSAYRAAASVPESVPRPESFGVRLSGERWPQLFLLLWVVGAALATFRLGRSYLSLRRVERESEPLAERYQRRMSHWTETCGISRKVSLRGSARVNAPLMLGLRGATILFPEGLAERLSEDEFDQVLLHELAHVRRRDDWGNLAQRLAEAVLFFHPAVLWVGRQVGAERECACDQWVVSVTGAHRSYASCLTRLFELTRTASPAFMTPGVMTVRSHLSRRVETILRSRRPASARLSAAGLLLPLCLVLTATIHLGRLSPLIAVSAGETSADDSPGRDAPLRAAGRAEESLPANAGQDVWTANSPDAPAVLGRVLSPRDGGATIQGTPDGPVQPQPDGTADGGPHFSTAGGDTSQARAWSVVAMPAVQLAPPAAQSALGIMPTFSAQAAAPGDSSQPSTNRALSLQEATASALSSDEGGLPADFFRTVAALGNSGEQREILSALLKRPGLSRGNLIQALAASKSIDSDGEKAEFLVRAIAVCPAEREVLDAFFGAVSTVGSAGERRRVLTAVLVSKGRDKGALLRTLKAAAGIDSDGEKAELLVKAAGMYPIDGAALGPFLDVVGSVNSSGEQRRMLTALLRQSNPSNEVTVQAVRFARRITSDGEKAEFLTRVAQTCPLSEGLISAYAATASSIGSSEEQARALSAMAKRREAGRASATRTTPAAANDGAGD